MSGFWLVEVEPSGGKVLRYSNVARSIAGSRGTRAYRAGLQDLDASRGHAGLSIQITDSALPAPRRIPGSPVRVYRWQPGTDYDTAELFVRGVAAECVIEADSVSFEIDTLDNQVPPCPDTDAVVSLATADPSTGLTVFGEIGKRYPLVFGYPGWTGVGTRQGPGPAEDVPWPVVPCPMTAFPDDTVNYTTALQAARVVVSEDPRTCNPTTVRLREDEQGVEVDENVVSFTDALGRTMAASDFTATGGNALFPETGQGQDISVSYLAGYTPTMAPDALRDAFDVWVYMLERFGADTVDWSLMRSCEDLARPFKIDTWVTEVVEGGVWTWLEMFSEAMPFVVRQGPRGKYMLPIRATTDMSLVSRTVDLDNGPCFRQSGLRSTGVVANKRTAMIRDATTLTRNYDGYLTRLTLGAEASETTNLFGLTTAESRRNGICVASQARFGERVAEDLVISWTWDIETGWRCLEWLATRDALPNSTIEVTVPESWQLREQHQVWLKDSRLDIDEAAIVWTEPQVSSAGASCTLYLPGRIQ